MLYMTELILKMSLIYFKLFKVKGCVFKQLELLMKDVLLKCMQMIAIHL